MPANSLLCHLLSRVNEAERRGEMWDNPTPQLTVGVWVVLRTSTVLHCLLSFFSYPVFMSPLPTSLTDSWQSWPGIGAVQTSAFRTEDL